MKLLLRAKAKTLTKRITLISTAFVLAVSTLTAAAPFVVSQQASAVGGDTVSNIATFEAFKDALNDATVGYINLAPGALINAPEELVLSRSDVRINGNDSTITYTGPNAGVSGWNGLYVFQAYNVSNIEINSLRVAGADAGFLINGSQVTLKGNTHALNNEFGGIEVSKGSASGNSTLTLEGNLWDESNLEANGKPAVWLVNGQGSVVTTNLNSSLTTATHIKSDQTQYYLRAVNTGTVATNTTTGQTYATLQAAFTAANENDTVVLNKSTTVAAGAVANLISKKITFNGQGNTIKTLGARGSAGDQKNAGLIVESTADGTTVKNLTVEGIGGSTAAHGLIVHDANGTYLQNITAINNAGGVMINASAATLDTINTRGNAWYGVNIDKAGAILTIKGVNTHDEAAPLFVDNRNVGQVIDEEKRYDIIALGNTDTYVLDTTAPSISWQVQPAPLVKDTFAVRPITSEVGTLKAIYFDTISPSTLCWTLNSDHMNFDTSQASCPAVFAGLSDGTHKFIAVFSDANGNRTESTSNSFVLDRTGPTITLQPSSIGANGVYTKVGYNFFDANKVDKISINGVVKDLTNNNYSNIDNIGSPYWYGAVEGLNTLVAYDVAGNSTTLQFRIDRTGPSASSITSPTGWALAADTITWSASTDATGPVTYTLLRSNTPNVAADGVALVTDTTATSFGYTLPIGPQWLQVIAKDALGNVTAGPIQGAQIIGTPQVISPTPNLVLNASNGNSFTTEWTAVYGIGGVQSYEIRYGVDRDNSGTFEPSEYATRTVAGNVLSRTQQFTTNFQGRLSVEVRAIYNIAFSPFDSTSNRGPWSAPVFYSRDTIVNVAATAATYDTDAPVIEGTADTDATVTATIDGNDYPVEKTGATWKITIPSTSPLTAGTHTLVVTATDPSGNIATSSANIVVSEAEVEVPVDENEGGTNNGGTNTGSENPVSQPSPVTTTVTPVTPTITGPTSNFAAILGTGTAPASNNQAAQSGEVEGANTARNLAQAVDTDSTDGTVFGLAWYWWLLILAGLATIIWWIIAALRRRREEA